MINDIVGSKKKLELQGCIQTQFTRKLRISYNLLSSNSHSEILFCFQILLEIFG